jgi:RNA polymerase sigma factor (sigma-70 family)
MHRSSPNLSALYSRLHPLVYRRVLRHVTDPDEAQDLTQEAFLVLMRHLNRVGGSELEVLLFLYRASTCKVIDRARRKRRWSARLAWGFAGAATHEEAGERELHRVEAALDLAMLARGASARALEAAWLRFVEERTLADAGTRLGVCPRTVERLLKRLVERVHKREARMS